MENTIDCIKYSDEIRERLHDLINKFNIQPNIAVVMVGNNPASEIYVRNKVKVANTLGIKVDVVRFSASISESVLCEKIRELNKQNFIDGIIVQLPLPDKISKDNILREIDPKKDLDGLHPLNIGLLHSFKETPYTIDEFLKTYEDFIKKVSFLGDKIPYIPCTPLGCLHVISRTLRNHIKGKNAVIFGNSNLVSKPMARLLLQSGATTTTLHSKSKDYLHVIKNADIIVSATGKEQKNINLKNIKKDAILIDVGIRANKNNGIVGDLDFHKLSKTNKITPVPKGIGPMTITSLMLNSYIAFFRKKLSEK